jgi:hypothetical protein
MHKVEAISIELQNPHPLVGNILTLPRVDNALP